jgi:hypothetical protein
VGWSVAARQPVAVLAAMTASAQHDEVGLVERSRAGHALLVDMVDGENVSGTAALAAVVGAG